MTAPNVRSDLRRFDEAGVLSAFVALLAVTLLVIIGAAVDSGSAIAAQRLATDEAQQAARLGADQLSLSALRSGQLAIDSASAVEAATRYMALTGHPGTASVHGGVVTVRVVVEVPTTILGVVDIKDLIVSATASASDVQGVTRQD